MLQPADLPSTWVGIKVHIDLNTDISQDTTLGDCVGAIDVSARRVSYDGAGYSQTGQIIGSYVTRYASDADATTFLSRFSNAKLSTCLENEVRSEASTAQITDVKATVVVGPGASGPSNQAAAVTTLVTLKSGAQTAHARVTQIYLKGAKLVGMLLFTDSDILPLDPSLQASLITLFAGRVSKA